MPEISENKNVFPPLKTDEIFKTSYGVGHHWRPGCYFPDSPTEAAISADQNRIDPTANQVKPEDHFQTTTGTTHDIKIIPPELQVYRVPPPPSLRDVNYLNDFRTRYLARRINRPLSPSHQKSETHDSFQNIEIPYGSWRPLSMQPFKLDNHHKDGPSKNIIASTVNPDLAGRTIYPKDKEIIRCLDPYLSTTMKDHRYWTPEELEGVAKKDIATYWDLADYPKARGFGLKENPIPKASVPRDKLPMRDKTVFREATDHTRVLPVTFHVPHTGLKTLYQDDFQQPSSMLQRTDRLCPVETPFVLPEPDLAATYATPSMYQTEYSTIGKCQRNLL